ncbi:hypothetical protein YC2023_088730 [Brassica napus]
MAGYLGFATCKELKLLGSQGMYVVFAKYDQGSEMGLDALEVEDGMCVQRLFGFFDQWFQGSGVNIKLQRSSQHEETLIRFSAWDSVEICFCISGIRGESKEPTKSDVQEKVFIQVIVKDNLRITVGLLAVEMKPDELYSKHVRLRRSVLKRLQGDAEGKVIPVKKFILAPRVLGVAKY